MEAMKRTAYLAMVLALAGCSDKDKSSASVAEAKKEVAQQAHAEQKEVKSYSGPLGTEMGMSADDLQKAIGKSPESQDDYFYFYKTAPKPYPSFDQYAYFISDTHGLCKLVAYGEVKSSRYGIELKGKFEEVKDALATKYGNPSDSMDRLLRGSIWKDPEDFMMALAKGERFLNASWSAPKITLPSDLETVAIEAVAENGASGIGQIKVIYEYSNFKQCSQEFKNKADSAL